MKQELENIAIELSKWCKKYKKDYVTACYVDKKIMANIDTNDKDYDKIHIFIDENNNNKKSKEA